MNALTRIDTLNLAAIVSDTRSNLHSREIREQYPEAALRLRRPSQSSSPIQKRYIPGCLVRDSHLLFRCLIYHLFPRMPGSMDSFRAVQVRAGAEISDEGKHNAKTPMDIDIEVLAARARDVGKSLMKSDFEKLSTQLQDLEQPPSRRFGQTTPNSVYSNASSGASRNDFEMPPGLSASHCSTPSNGESMPRTPSDLSQLTPYHPGIKALAGAGRPRTSSPLVTGLNSANDSDASSIIEEEHSPSHLSRPSEEEQKRFTNSDPSHSEAHGRHRSSSFSAVQHQIYSPDVLSFQQEPELATRARRASLPIVIDQNEALTWFQTSPGHRRDINLPVGLPAHPKRAAPTRPEDEIETIGGAEVAVEDEKVLPPSDEKIASSDSSKASVWSRAAASIEATYYPSESPPLIMPTGPTDLEKTLYLKTNRLGLYSFGVFSFLSLSVGMWLFVVSSVSVVPRKGCSESADLSSSLYSTGSAPSSSSSSSTSSFHTSCPYAARTTTSRNTNASSPKIPSIA